MTLSNPSPMLSRTSNWFFLLVLIYFILATGLPVEAQAAIQEKKPKQETLFESMKKNPWAEIKGFRSAKFGMDEKNVFRAIAKDFKLPKSKVKKKLNPQEKTAALEIIVPELFATGGTAKVGYVFGYKSKKLMHINILWGKGAAENVNGQSVVDTANLLRMHFMKKRYKEKSLVANGKLSANRTMVFRGRDENDRMIVVMLNTGPVPEGGNTEESVNNVSLVLSYVESPDEPDVRRISIKDGEF